jgi:HAD superfamily hydrolase (TIGR01509 family)
MIKALIFDFDGVIVDTETPEFNAWREVYGKFHQQLPLSEWQKALGTSSRDFDPAIYLEKLVGHSIDKKKAKHDQRVISLSQISRMKPLPGVEKLIDSAHHQGIRLAIASNSSSDWVWCNLARLDLARFFETICTGDEVHTVKPDPALYLLALKELGITAGEAVVFEDSPFGITAAQNAGIFCVAIPNRISGQLNIDHADLIVNSLEEITIEGLEKTSQTIER